MENGNTFGAGREATYQEIYKVLADPHHIRRCGTCRVCGVIKQTVEVLTDSLADKLTRDELYGLAIILARTGNSTVDREGNVTIDLWREFDGTASA